MKYDNDNQPIRYGPWLPTKAAALAVGATQYFNGNPCLRGHVSPRFTSSRNCVACRYEDGLKLRTSAATAQSVRDYMRVYQAQRKAEDPEFLEKVREIGRVLDAKPERRKKQNERKKWRIVNEPGFREKVNDQNRPVKKLWKKANPEIVNAHSRTRRARRRGADGVHTGEDILRIHAAQKYKCAECGVSTKKAKHVDHIMPLALGGSNWPENLQILCPLCNDIKGAKHPLEFAKQNGRLL